jgi:glycine/D-amino acid oxidase-like deaminating enzyme
MRLHALAPHLMHATVLGHTVGLRPDTPDHDPYIGAVAGYDGLYLAAGHAYHGILLAPAHRTRDCRCNLERRNRTAYHAL